MPDSVVVLALDEVRFALSTSVVERVVRAVEVSPLADAPDGIIGVVNMQGRILPVLDVRPRFGLATREVEISDHFVIAHVGERQVAILVDAPVDVVGAQGHTVPVTMELLSGLGAALGIMVQGHDLVPIQDLARLLPPEPGITPSLKLAA